MAAPGPQKDRNCCGYECEFVQPPPGYFQTECSVCLLVLRSPHITSCCGKNFCKECIDRVQESGKGCPLCNQKGFTLVYNREKDTTLKQLEVYCTHCKIGCEWKGKLEMLDNHLNVDPEPEKQLEGCAFVEVQCYHDGCGQSFQRQLIAKHQSEECPQRPFSCKHCRTYKATYHDVTTNHWPVCKCYPVSCPHNCTQKSIQRQNLEDHLKKECPLQEVECEFKYAGCKTKLPRQDMPEHLGNSKEMVRHMSLLAQQNQQLTQQNQRLTQQNQRLTQQNQEFTTKMNKQFEMLLRHVQIVPGETTCPVRIVMPNFDRWKSDKKWWYSQGFYTHPQGYKLCLGVDANGYGYGEGIHVCCSIYLMRGEFDNHLKWPFRGDVTIQLLNQLEDNNHHTRTVNFNDNTPDEYTAQVTSGEIATRGWGYHQFIPHRKLGYNAVTDCQYLMNDCLYFQVKTLNLDLYF